MHSVQPRFTGNQPPRASQHRTNLQIRVIKVRVVQDGNALGVMPTFEARKLAVEAGLDLVEIAPTADPPVCHIMDYGKWKYEQSIKQKENKKKVKSVSEKELQLSPGIGEHDVEVKVNQAREFLGEGRKVQFVVKYTGRENAHKELGFKLIDNLVDKLSDLASVEGKPRLEGKKLYCRFEPKKKD